MDGEPPHPRRDQVGDRGAAIAHDLESAALVGRHDLPFEQDQAVLGVAAPGLHQGEASAPPPGHGIPDRAHRLLVLIVSLDTADQPALAHRERFNEHRPTHPISECPPGVQAVRVVPEVLRGIRRDHKPLRHSKAAVDEEVRSEVLVLADARHRCRV